MAGDGGVSEVAVSDSDLQDLFSLVDVDNDHEVSGKEKDLNN